MTTIDIIPLEENKHYYLCNQYQKELNEVKDQITCLQKSVANLRKDLPLLIIEICQNRKRKIWI
jgi:septation ring formation regulator EzrA